MKYLFTCDIARARVPHGKTRSPKGMKLAAKASIKRSFNAKDEEGAARKVQKIREGLFNEFLIPVNDVLECLTTKKAVSFVRGDAALYSVGV